MNVEWLRDVVVSITGLVAIGALIFFSVLAYSVYNRLKPILENLKATSASAQAISTYAEKEIAKPLGQIAMAVQGIYQGVYVVSKLLKFTDFFGKGETKMSKEETGGFGVGLLVGAVIGLAVGILYAPRPGKETRALIKEKAEETKETAEDIVKKAKERAEEIIEKAKAKAAEIRKSEEAA